MFVSRVVSVRPMRTLFGLVGEPREIGDDDTVTRIAVDVPVWIGRVGLGRGFFDKGAVGEYDAFQVLIKDLHVDHHLLGILVVELKVRGSRALLVDLNKDRHGGLRKVLNFGPMDSVEARDEHFTLSREHVVVVILVLKVSARQRVDQVPIPSGVEANVDFTTLLQNHGRHGWEVDIGGELGVLGHVGDLVLSFVHKVLVVVRGQDSKTRVLFLVRWLDEADVEGELVIGCLNPLSLPDTGWLQFRHECFVFLQLLLQSRDLESAVFGQVGSLEVADTRI